MMPLSKRSRPMKRCNQQAHFPDARIAIRRHLLRRRVALFAAVVLATCFAQPLFAQATTSGRATINGVVSSSANGNPIIGVTVSIPDTPFQTTTDAEGRYTLRNVPMGVQTIDARRLGYAVSHEE